MKFTLAIPLFLLMSCTFSNTQSAATETKDSSSQIVNSPSEESVISDDEIQERGILKEIEDSGYPFATLTIEFPERKFSETFTLNFEEVRSVVNPSVLNKWKGKYVSFRYTSQITNALLDIQKNGKSMMGEYAVEVTPEMSKIVGILEGANQETAGDLPSKITIGTLSFEFFVTKAMVEANGTKVVGYYEERTQNQIKAIKLLAQ
jgi:hypothetical protein